MEVKFSQINVEKWTKFHIWNQIIAKKKGKFITGHDSGLLDNESQM